VKDVQVVGMASNLHRAKTLQLFVNSSGKLVTTPGNSERMYKAVRDTLFIVNDNWIVWNGRIGLPDDSDEVRVGGSIELVHNFKDKTSGMITLGNTIYHLRPLSNGQHALFNHDSDKLFKEIKESQKRDDELSNIRKSEDTSKYGSDNKIQTNGINESTLSSSCNFYLDIAVFYTPEANNNYDIQSEISNAISSMNTAFSKSQINNLIANEVHTSEMDFDFKSNNYLWEDLDDFADSTRVKDALSEQGAGADVAVLLMDYDEYPSQWNNDTQDPSGVASGDVGARHAIVYTKFANLHTQTFAHEVGHLQGAEHAPGDGGLGDPEWARGYRFETNIDGETYRRSTIMAYKWHNGTGYMGLKRFSNPNITWSPSGSDKEVPLGTSSQKNYLQLKSSVNEVCYLGGGDLDVVINGDVNSYSGEGFLTSSVCGGSPDYTYDWLLANPPDGPKYPIGSNSTLDYIFRSGDNLVNLEVESSDGLTGEDTRYYYVTSSYYKARDDIDNGNVSLDQENNTPATTEISNIYPNPFNPSTQIDIGIDEAKEVKVSVYNLTGKRISTLHDGRLSKGIHKFTFNANNLSSGTYIVRMIADGQTYQQNIVLMK